MALGKGPSGVKYANSFHAVKWIWTARLLKCGPTDKNDMSEADQLRCMPRDGIQSAPVSMQLLAPGLQVSSRALLAAARHCHMS